MASVAFWSLVWQEKWWDHKNMPKRPQGLTLANIGRLLDQKLLPIHRQLVNLLGETVFTRNEVNCLRAEMNTKFEEVNSGFEKVDSEMKQRFDCRKYSARILLEVMNKQLTNWNFYFYFNRQTAASLPV